MYRMVMDRIKNPIVFNICVLGALVGLTELIKPESVMKVLEKRVPQDMLDINARALEIGLDLGVGGRK